MRIPCVNKVLINNNNNNNMLSLYFNIQIFVCSLVQPEVSLLCIKFCNGGQFRDLQSSYRGV